MKLGESAFNPASAGSIEPDPPSIRAQSIERRNIIAALKELDIPALQLPNHGYNITIDSETRQTIVQIVDRGSGEVVQQFPGKEAVERARFYHELEK